jgi:hypothetical protein
VSGEMVSREMGLGGEVGLPRTSGIWGVTKTPMFKPNASFWH